MLVVLRHTTIGGLSCGIEAANEDLFVATGRYVIMCVVHLTMDLLFSCIVEIGESNFRALIFPDVDNTVAALSLPASGSVTLSRRILPFGKISVSAMEAAGPAPTQDVLMPIVILAPSQCLALTRSRNLVA